MFDNKSLPKTVSLLGYLGLAPQLIFLLMALSGEQMKWVAPAAGFAYAALIFSFLGGVWWGRALVSDSAKPALFALSVLPSLIALGCFMPWVWGLPWPGPYLITLGLLIAASCLVDRYFEQKEGKSADWITLRTRLSLALGAITIALGIV